MENQKKPRLIRLSRTPKTNPRQNFCSKSLSTMGSKLVVFQPFTLNPSSVQCIVQYQIQRIAVLELPDPLNVRERT